MDDGRDPGHAEITSPHHSESAPLARLGPCLRGMGVPKAIGNARGNTAVHYTSSPGNPGPVHPSLSWPPDLTKMGVGYANPEKYNLSNDRRGTHNSILRKILCEYIFISKLQQHNKTIYLDGSRTCSNHSIAPFGKCAFGAMSSKNSNVATQSVGLC